MADRLPPLNWLRAFEAAGRHMSFTEAARELGITQSAVSQQVRLLEQHLGRLLFHRLPRGLKLADAGEALLPLVRETFGRLAEGTAEIFGRTSGDRLAIRVTPAFAVLWLAPRLPRFYAAHPEIKLRIISSTWLADQSDPGIDLEVRYGRGNGAGPQADRLTWDHVFPVCSPALCQGPRRLTAPADLAGHRLLHAIGFRDGWAHWLAQAGVADQVDAARGQEFDTAILALDLAMQGAGVALGRTCFVAPLIAAGRLVAPFDVTLTTEEAFYVVSPEGRSDSQAAQLFRHWLLAEAKAPASE
ncbi:transcriptional regulator GcvA [Rhodospirillaceae bacterium SYSU D60014]|uniref:transcriptional regulator GcvA n=1 Tax=Virgifigura deserti TaxID=2268457 RepID=UPI000E673577